jgi:hypothetical protein
MKDMSKYTGDPMGSGNPPGAYRKAYTSDPGSGEGHFNRDESYRGSMHVDINESATEVGNQPKEQKSYDIKDYANGPGI